MLRPARLECVYINMVFNTHNAAWWLLKHEIAPPPPPPPPKGSKMKNPALRAGFYYDLHQTPPKAILG